MAVKWPLHFLCFSPQIAAIHFSGSAKWAGDRSTCLTIPAPAALKHYVGFKLGTLRKRWANFWPGPHGQRLPQNLRVCLSSEELRRAERRDHPTLPHVPQALVLPSLGPPHTIARGNGAARFTRAASPKGCRWHFQMNIYELLSSFQSCRPGPALL